MRTYAFSLSEIGTTDTCVRTPPEPARATAWAAATWLPRLRRFRGVVVWGILWTRDPVRRSQGPPWGDWHTGPRLQWWSMNRPSALQEMPSSKATVPSESRRRAEHFPYCLTLVLSGSIPKVTTAQLATRIPL